MAATALVEFDMEAGAELLGRLDEAAVPVAAALWLHFPEADEWRLVIGSPLVDQAGAHETYARIQRVLADSGLGEQLPLRAITVMSPAEPLLQALRGAVSVRDAGVVRLGRSVVEGVYIEDAYIYRLT
jgi:hypothetical protein